MTGAPVVHQADAVAKDLGIEPHVDPVNNRKFYLWDDMFPLDGQGLPTPRFGAQETAKTFFAKGSDWLRWRYHATEGFPDGYFVLDGVLLEPKRTKSGQRYFTLADIERMAHALASNGAIGGEQAGTIVSICLEVARLYRVV